MSTLIDHTDAAPRPAPAAGPDAADATAAAAQRLRAVMAACRLQFRWLGTQKALSAAQRSVAAEAFDAEGEYVSAGKRLLDVRHPAYRAVTAIRTKAVDHWRGLTLPYPEPGVRLIRRARAAEFAEALDDYRAELHDAVAGLDRHYAELKAAARQRLGALYDERDYPDSLAGHFDLSYDFPEIDPPAYLVELSPGLYAQEQQRIRARFEEAVRLAETAFAEEFARLVDHLTERITGANEDGSPKVFRDSVVSNLGEFFDRFRSLNVRSNEQLDELVERAQAAVRGVAARDLRDSATLRRHVATQLSRVQSELDGLLVDRPRRRILRPPASENG